MSGAPVTARAAAIALVMVALCAAPAHAAYPGQNGRLVFFQADTGGVDPVGLAVADARGRNQTLRPLGPACGGEGEAAVPGPCAIDPVWSPDGERIAFGLGRGLATMRPDGGDLRRIPLPTLAKVSSPSWSPDGRRIAFSAVPRRRRELFVVDAAGGAAVQLTFRGGSEPAWSIRGEVAFVRRGQLFRMAVPFAVPLVPLTELRPIRLTRLGGASPTWSPTGSRLAFIRKVRLRRGSRSRGPVLLRMTRDARRLRRLTAGRAETPAWAPDGRRILFVRFDGFNSFVLAVPPDGGRVVTVTGGLEGRRSAVFDPDQQPLAGQ